MQYVYTLKGRHICYKPPNKTFVESKVDSWLGQSMQKTLNKKNNMNFILSNIRSSRSQKIGKNIT